MWPFILISTSAILFVAYHIMLVAHRSRTRWIILAIWFLIAVILPIFLAVNQFMALGTKSSVLSVVTFFTGSLMFDLVLGLIALSVTRSILIKRNKQNSTDILPARIAPLVWFYSFLLLFTTLLYLSLVFTTDRGGMANVTMTENQ